MKDLINLLKQGMAILPFIVKILDKIEEAKDEREKQKMLKALKSGDIDTLNKLLLK